jgi:type IV fimbrial biogenesis protein FimT
VLIQGRQRGFNLIEAVVTISVLGILLAATLPSMSDWIRSTHVRTLAETTQSGLNKARQEAMKRNKVVTFWLVSPATTPAPDDSCGLLSTSGAWVVSLDDPTGKCGNPPSTSDAPRIVETYGPGQGATGVSVAAFDDPDPAAGDPTSSVSFNGFGQRVGTGIARIEIAHATEPTVRPLRIEISSSGGIRMCDPAVDAQDSRACKPLPP